MIWWRWRRCRSRWRWRNGGQMKISGEFSPLGSSVWMHGSGVTTEIISFFFLLFLIKIFDKKKGSFKIYELRLHPCWINDEHAPKKFKKCINFIEACNIAYGFWILSISRMQFWYLSVRIRTGPFDWNTLIGWNLCRKVLFINEREVNVMRRTGEWKWKRGNWLRNISKDFICIHKVLSVRIWNT